jgi:hypothetical protein
MTGKLRPRGGPMNSSPPPIALSCRTVTARPPSPNRPSSTGGRCGNWGRASARWPRNRGPLTRELTSCMGRGQLTGDQAVVPIIGHLLGGSRPD